MMNPVKMLGDAIRRRMRAWRAWSEHIDRIVESARDVLRNEYQARPTERARLSRDPPAPLRNMPRPGPAWFLTFGRTDARSIYIVEVDDATEQVTRVWWPRR
jgi:hypothetical protein